MERSRPDSAPLERAMSETLIGVPFDRDQGSPTLIEAKQLNVSHVFNEVVRLTGLGVLK